MIFIPAGFYFCLLIVQNIATLQPETGLEILSTVQALFSLYPE